MDPNVLLKVRPGLRVGTCNDDLGIAIVPALTGLGLLKVPPEWVGIIGTTMVILGPALWGYVKHVYRARAFIHLPIGRRDQFARSGASGPPDETHP